MRRYATTLLPGRLRLAAAGALLGVGLLAGCMGTGQTPADESEMQVAFEVTNDPGGARFMTVWLVPDIGDAEMLGTVLTGETRQFRYGPVGPGPGSYRLVGRDGEEVVTSSTFRLSGDAVVRWDTSSEIVDVESVREPDVSGR